MSKIAYVDGLYLPHRHARVHIEDRGYQFADGVYEVIAIADGNGIDLDRHMDRLERSLGALGIPMPMSRRALAMVLDRVVRRNRVARGIVYLQVTRGAASRDHAGPAVARPVVTVTARRQPPPDAGLAARGVDVITMPDLRWRRNDIKSISLLPNVLGKRAARTAGAYEAWQVDDDGMVTEGTSTTAWIVTEGRRVVTHPLDQAILGGVTRMAVVELAREAGYTVEERPFSRDEALAADEAYLTSTTAYVLPVVRIDGESIGGGAPGPVTRDLAERYRRRVDGIKTP